MTDDYLVNLKYLGLISRLKRLSESTIADGRKLYRYIDIGIEPNWFLIFRILMEKKESSISEIASILQFAHPSVISIVKKMEKAGYLTIQSSALDKRKQNIRMSKKAKKELPEMQNVWDASELAIASLFKSDTFLKELEKMEKALQKKGFFSRVLDQLDYDDISISPFSSKNSKDFASLNQEWLNKYFEIEPIDKAILQNPIQYIIKKGGYILMANFRDQVVGTVALMPKNDAEIELCRMAVDSNYQGRGIGKRLMEEAIEKVAELPFRSIILYSNTLLKPAIQLYKKFGFKKEPLENNVIYNRANIKMRLNL